MSKKKWEYRDVSTLLQSLRALLLGRKHNLHQRFPPNVASRSIPSPDIPRGPEYKYSKQYYYGRSAFDSVKPPVIAPVAEGPQVGSDPTKKAQPGGYKPDSICFPGRPTPGAPWAWDGHNYFECVEDPPPPPCPPPRPQSPCPKAEASPCAPACPPPSSPAKGPVCPPACPPPCPPASPSGKKC